jgi:chromosome segregation ATPase
MSTLPAPTPGDEPSAPASLSGEGERGRLREFLAAQQRRWSDAELQLIERLEELMGELSAGGRAPGTAETAVARPECDPPRAAEVEALKARIADLERQLAQGQACGRGSAGAVLDWEAEKNRILAALELEVSDVEAGPAQRLEIERVIRTTDRLVAEKQQQIEQLQALLTAQSSNLASVAVGAAALGRSLDQDAIIRQERETLRQLQEQWREKLRQAEIEISVERAQIARQKAELDARCRALALPAVAAEDTAGGKLGDRPPRGQWLARLGLTSLEQRGEGR